MNYIETKNEEKGKKIKLFYEDYGEGQPVILIHGWPLSHRMWEYQVEKIVDAGFRCISYDRRGFGDSDKPWEGYDYDTLASDLNDVITALGLSKVVVVGFSMGGGEVARFIGKYGTANIEKAALISAVPPFMLKTDDNPDGLENEVFEGFKNEIRKDRQGFLAGFGDKFYNFSKNSSKLSKDLKHHHWAIACSASPKATLDCIDSFGLTDFREDLKSFDVPTLVVHGDDDEIVPIDIAGKKSKELIKNSTFEVIEGGPHGLIVTHKDELNEILVRFLKS
ncbi:alpha/beta fold hydrolase [Salegentibacter salegens]|uniref:Peroxiredoxin n=1 Tax=Salegentibacter salegens TaxID=143223 RepID=A0A1M7NJX3_9FLAO|nr:alpha/beta hydrolase [Salegentibacter salegens]PRX43343.1 peroxiredoxin [Salegentibacter salegens]SHN03561.1 peroxiredoxin [Salegentibacter salegens]